MGGGGEWRFLWIFLFFGVGGGGGGPDGGVTSKLDHFGGLLLK